MLNASAAQAKANAIIEKLSRLATAYNEPLTAERIEIYTSVLVGLTSEELSHGFTRALCETKWWPKPSELLEFCTGHVSAMTDKLTIDEAWSWVVRYIEMFGIPSSTRWEIQGHTYHGQTFSGAMLRSGETQTLATTALFYELTKYEVPQIPDIVSQTLTAMAGRMKMGLVRIKDAMSGWNSAEESKSSSRESAFVRRDWDEYCSRALAATRAQTPSTVNPAMQLAGDVAPMFPPFTPQKIAVRIEQEWRKYKVNILELEQANKLFEAGTLPRHLNEAVAQYHEQIQRQEHLMSIPHEFAAVYRGIYDSLELSNAIEPWPRMGRFTIENGSGSQVIFDDLPMVINDFQLKRGQVVRFTAMLKELGFTVCPRFYFDLSNVIKNAHKEG